MNIKIFLVSLIWLIACINAQAQPSKDLAIAQPQWEKAPVLQYTNVELAHQDRNLSLKIIGNSAGDILKTEVLNSSGIIELDQKVQHDIMQARFKPQGQRWYATLPVALKLNQAPLDANSWLIQPNLSYHHTELQGQNRRLNLRLSRDHQGFIQRIEILDSTGLKNLDEKIMAQVQNARFNPKLTPQHISLPIVLTSPIYTQQSQHIQLHDDLDPEDAAKIWQYFPKLQYTAADLNGQTRYISFSLNFNTQGKLVQSQITQSTGIKALDHKIYQQIQTSLLYRHHAPARLNVPFVLELLPE